MFAARRVATAVFANTKPHVRATRSSVGSLSKIDLVSNKKRSFSTSKAEKEPVKEGLAEEAVKDSDKDSDVAPVSPRVARATETTGIGAPLSKLQRAGLGVVGGLLGTGGASSYIYLNWPIISQNSACILAACVGVSLMSTAATGGQRARKKKDKKKQPLLELKVLNEKVRLSAEMKALKDLGAQRKWPLQVQKELTLAQAKTVKDSKKEAEGKVETLLQHVKRELASGKTPDQVQQRLRPRLFVFDFEPTQPVEARKPGAMRDRLKLLSTHVTFILAAASPHDEALLRLSSPGGAVPPYGLAAAQLQRLRDANIRLTICVDTMAASGGYLMASVADHIVAAPFAMVGSIGVIVGSPNIHKVLERNDVEYLTLTAGKHKRTLNVLTPNTEEGVAKTQEFMEGIHNAFQAHVQKFRPNLKMEEVATGEVWYGSGAQELGLVDEVGTSDDQIRLKINDGFDAVELTKARKQKKGLAKFFEGFEASHSVESLFARTAAQAVKGVWEQIAGYIGQGPSRVAEPRVEAPKQFVKAAMP